MILHSADDVTGEFKVYSRLTGELVYDTIMKDIKMQQEIIDAIRCAENYACAFIKNKAVVAK